ncbi:ABC transporter substrate-binding protein [Cohnella boryungensis]|uniref:ABC transporter substrate-binding protein n=1 Tax=Cohnella boryungensis TaxID=768479 RepID=A0ABV8SDX0_9BACL
MKVEVVRSRAIGLMIFALVLVLIVSGCGNGGGSGSVGSSNNEGTASASIAGETEAPDSGPATRIYKALNGDIEVPANPKHVASLVFVGELLALGVKPIGTGQAFLEKGLFVEELKGAQPIGDEPSPEKVLALQPDLIIVHNFVKDEIVEQLTKIAPTVVMPFNDRGPIERLRMFAELLGKEKEAEQFIQKYEAKAAEAKKSLEGTIKQGETVAYYEIWGKSLWVMSEANGRGVYNLYNSLGLEAPEKVKTDVIAAGKGIDISLEVLPDYAADHMFVGVYAGDGGDKRAEEIFAGALWQGLPAFKNKQVYVVDIDQFAASDINALYKQLDLQLDILKGAQ